MTCVFYRLFVCPFGSTVSVRLNVCMFCNDNETSKFHIPFLFRLNTFVLKYLYKQKIDWILDTTIHQEQYPVFSNSKLLKYKLGYFVNWEGITRRKFVVLNSPRRTKIISYCLYCIIPNRVVFLQRRYWLTSIMSTYILG